MHKQINENDYVIIKKDCYARLVQVAKRKPVYIGKQKIFLNGIIGYPYSSTFEIKGTDLLKAENKKVSTELCNLTDEVSALRDNRNLFDDQTSQKLTKEEIETFKAEGVSGEKIIENLIENSSTFKEKTPYAQAKYLMKKQQKYLSYVKILQPTTRLLAEMYYEQGPQKINNLRIDSLSQMLTMSNIRHCGKYIVVDAVQGLLVAAVLERLGSEGCVVHLYLPPGPVSSYRQAVSALNISSELLCEQLFGLPLHEVVNCCEEVPVNITEVTQLENTYKYAEDTKITQLTDKKENTVEKEYSEKEKEKMLRKIARHKEKEKAKQVLKEKTADGLLIAIKHHPSNILLTLLDFLAPSSSFAVFCASQEPLIECYEKLKSTGEAVFMKLTESWLRNYQVMLERTHPDTTISGSSGYLLTGIKVIPK